MTKKEVAAKIFALLNFDEVQNRFFTPPMTTLDERELDRLPNAAGEFGREASNPILCNNPVGEMTYLSKLRTAETDSKVVFHRLGSGKGGVDIFEVVALDGSMYDIFYLDMYHAHKSKIAPKGYTLAKDVRGITGTHVTIPDFPLGLEKEARMAMLQVIGMPVLDPTLENVDWDKLAEIVRAARARKKSNS